MRRAQPFATILTLLLWTASADAGALKGETVDYDYDARDIGHPERAWHGRAYLPPELAESKGPVPLVVFLHGLNAALIKYRWMGGGREGDVRRIVGDMVADGLIEPVVVAGPSSVIASQVARGASWNHLDFDGFVDRTIAAVGTKAAIDPKRIIVAGHSGAGCSMAGGLAGLDDSKRELLGILSIDTCMIPAIGKELATAGPRTHVVVSYQRSSWTKRPFAAFRRLFEKSSASAELAEGTLRELDEQHPKSDAHNATVALTLRRWLPRMLKRH